MRDNEPILTHEWIWTAIDTLARRHALTPSSLARLAGLDATTFNRSKRFTTEGRPRWPSTESIAKVLEATRTSLDEFAAIQLADMVEVPFDETAEGPVDGVPVVGEIRDAAVAGWEPLADQIASASGEGVRPGRRRFALAVADGSLEPVYSQGHTLVISEAASSRPGDRVVVKPAGRNAVPRLLISASPTVLQLGRLGGGPEPRAIRRRDIDWMARIVLVRH
ncbi:MAG: helix-turn-helix transcriptional regulator [Hyphomicrobiaceae bacterium]|nr:helix-turn-helix transcriptional regulator [Hyphomicrobiaceae bacterium]